MYHYQKLYHKSFLILQYNTCTGFGIGASYGVSIAYAQEMVPKEKRSLTGLMLNIMWILGTYQLILFPEEHCLLAFKEELC